MNLNFLTGDRKLKYKEDLNPKNPPELILMMLVKIKYTGLWN
jgi:hypothetical protein